MSASAHDFFVHESAYVDEPTTIGPGTKIWHFCHIMKDCRIGAGCNFGQNVFIAAGCRVGNNVKIQNNVSVYAGVELEDDVFCGPSMVFTNVMNPRSHVERKDEYRTTLVQRGSTIGANATIVCGVTLGKYCFVGAGSVVTKNVPDYALYFGSPARLRGWRCSCGDELTLSTQQDRDEKADCAACGRHYARRGNEVREIVEEGK